MVVSKKIMNDLIIKIRALVDSVVDNNDRYIGCYLIVDGVILKLKKETNLKINDKVVIGLDLSNGSGYSIDDNICYNKDELKNSYVSAILDRLIQI